MKDWSFTGPAGSRRRSHAGGRGLELNPDNYLIRKQIWAVENPERFYEGDVDYNWQREQTAKGL